MTPATSHADPFAAEVFGAVHATRLSAISLPAGKRQEWESRLTELLVRGPERNAHEAAFDDLLEAAPLQPLLAEELYAVELPAERIVTGGLGVLSDVELVALAARPEALRVLAELVEETVDEPDAWPQWRRLLAEGDDLLASDVRPALITKLTDIARAHPAYAGTPTPAPSPSRSLRLAPAWAALAASVLLAGGFLGGRLSRPAGREVAFVGSVTASREPNRGGAGFHTVVRVENRSDRRAFCAVVGLKGARSPVEFEEKGQYIELAPGEARAVELPEATFAGLTDALVVLTATPAGEPVQRALETTALPADPAAARARVADDLARLGFSGVAVQAVQLPVGER